MTDALTPQARTPFGSAGTKRQGAVSKVPWTPRKLPDGDKKKPLAIATRGDHLGYLVRSWRERLNPDAISSFGGFSRRKRAVSQEDIARLVGCSSQWYGRLERGDTDIYSADFLERIATALCLSSGERNLLFIYALGHEPACVNPPEPLCVPEPLRRFVREQMHPAYISDVAGRIFIYNGRMAEWFPWIAVSREPNLIRWAFTTDEAQAKLYNWATEWAPFLLAQMMIARAQNPNAAGLNQLIVEILTSNELARMLWSRGPELTIDLDAGHRKLNVTLENNNVKVVNLLTLKTAPASQIRLVVFLPT